MLMMEFALKQHYEPGNAMTSLQAQTQNRPERMVASNLAHEANSKDACVHAMSGHSEKGAQGVM